MTKRYLGDMMRTKIVDVFQMLVAEGGGGLRTYSQVNDRSVVVATFSDQPVHLTVYFEGGRRTSVEAEVYRPDRWGFERWAASGDSGTDLLAAFLISRGEYDPFVLLAGESHRFDMSEG